MKILLTSKWCGGCSDAKKLLRKHKIKFKEVDVDTTKGENLADEHNVKVVPTMIIDGKKTDDIKKWVKK